MTRMLYLAAAVALLSAVLVVPVHARAAASGATAAGETFIVVLDPSVPSAAEVAREHARRFSAQILYLYEDALKG